MQLIVTGTDTGVGKTVVSALLCKRYNACYWKPIQTGDDCDTTTVSNLVGVKTIEPVYRFNAPLSPLAAAQKEGKLVDFDKLQLPTKESLIIEGAGGLMVPITKDRTMSDLFKVLNIPIVIVARASLGTLNHTLLTVNVAKQYGLKIHSIIVNGDDKDGNTEIIEAYTGQTVERLKFMDLSSNNIRQ